MAFFLHLGVRFDDDPDSPSISDIEQVLNKAKDWYRYTPNCWIIYTAREAKWWSDKLREIPGMEAHTAFLIGEMAISDRQKRSGWLKGSVWDWIKKKRGPA